MKHLERRDRRDPRVTIRTAAWAWLVLAGTAAAAERPRVGAEIVVQHAREISDGWIEPTEFPVSGGATLTLRWSSGTHVHWVTGLGYEQRATQSQLTPNILTDSPASSQWPPPAFEVQREWKSLVVPLHATVDAWHIVRIEAGPEWRWLLQHRARAENVVFITSAADFGQWYDVTSEYNRGSFALALGIGAHWPWGGGDAGLGLRWCEGVGDQHKADYITSRFREFQLVMRWDR